MSDIAEWARADLCSGLPGLGEEGAERALPGLDTTHTTIKQQI